MRMEIVFHTDENLENMNNLGRLLQTEKQLVWEISKIKKPKIVNLNKRIQWGHNDTFAPNY